MEFTPSQSDCPPLVTPDGNVKTDKCFFPLRRLPDLQLDSVETESMICEPCELQSRSPTDKMTPVLSPESIATAIACENLQDYGYEWYPDRRQSVQLSSSVPNGMKGQDHELTSLSPCAAKPIIHPPRLQDWLSYFQADSADSTPSDESPQTGSYSCSDYSLDSAFETICNEVKPFDCRGDAIPANRCLNMLLEGTNVNNEQRDIKEQGEDISEWPTTESMLSNAWTSDVDQHTYLRDGEYHDKIGPFAASANKRKYLNPAEWINSDVQHSASLSCEDARTDASPQSAFSAYSDSPSLSDREHPTESSRRVKNNAASRRSRASRKQRFQHMQMQVRELDSANRGLRETLKELDRLLAEAKEILLQQATNCNQDSAIKQDNQTLAYLNTVQSSFFQSEVKL